MNDDVELDSDVVAALNRQDEALALLERLRRVEPISPNQIRGAAGERRDGRRWPKPEGVTLELHDGILWQPVNCLDLGVGGARADLLPDWAKGPTPGRLKAESLGSVLMLSDVMWHDTHSGITGLRFEFLDSEEHDLWASMLLDALLLRYAV